MSVTATLCPGKRSKVPVSDPGGSIPRDEETQERGLNAPAIVSSSESQLTARTQLLLTVITKRIFAPEISSQLIGFIGPYIHCGNACLVTSISITGSTQPVHVLVLSAVYQSPDAWINPVLPKHH